MMTVNYMPGDHNDMHKINAVKEGEKEEKERRGGMKTGRKERIYKIRK